MRLSAWVVLALLLLVGVPLADLLAAGWVYGPSYVVRLVLWRHPAPDDSQRFPARAIPAATQPRPFASDPAGPTLVEDAVHRVAGESLESLASRTGTTSLLVLQHGKLLYQGYFSDATPDQPVPSFSMAKSVTALLVGLAGARMPALDSPAAALLPQIPGLADQRETWRCIMAMRAGWRVDRYRWFGPLGTPWNDDKLTYFAPDLRRVAAAVRPGQPPDQSFFYDDRNAMLVGMALERATGRRVSDLLAELWQQIGAEYPASWNLDSTASGFEKMESGINAVPIDFLRLGALVLNGGRLADGTPILPAGWIDTITSPTSNFGDGAFYGLFWWGFALPDGARDVYAGGIFGQVLYVSPRKDAVILRTGTSDAGIDSWPRLIQKLATALPP